MLVLTRKAGEKIEVGDEIEIVVVEIAPGKVRLGITAPRQLPVYRSELLHEERKQRWREREAS